MFSLGSRIATPGLSPVHTVIILLSLVLIRGSG